MTTETNIGHWYDQDNGNGNWIDTVEDIENTNSNKLMLVLVQNPTGHYLLVSYDQPNDGDGGTINIAYSCSGDSGSTCPIADTDEETPNGNLIEFEWQECCSDGVIFGPFSGSNTVCMDHSNISNLENGARYVDGAFAEHSIASLAEMGSLQICVTFTV